MRKLFICSRLFPVPKRPARLPALKWTPADEAAGVHSSSRLLGAGARCGLVNERRDTKSGLSTRCWLPTCPTMPRN